ncbi:MAG: GDP-mannose 4,6-dehydratase [Bdellovibrionota bacterium]
MKKHIIVTGGAGFIGSHLCDALLQDGYAVTALDNFITGSKENLAEAEKKQDFHFLEWDVCHSLDMPIEGRRLPLLNKYGLFGLFHFACPASPVDFDRIPFEILAVDSVGTMHTVDLASKYNARYLLASTSEIYGDPLEHPQKEDYFGNVNTIGPRACYDETKRFAEAYVSTAIRGVPTTSGEIKRINGGMVRIFNTYGPRMRPDDGRIVPELCVRALSGQELTVHGDGQQTRSFCYVSDLVDGIIKLFKSDVSVPVNIGNPHEKTVLEFTKAVLSIVGNQLPIKHLAARPDDPKRRCPDISRARRLLGWEPKVDLEEGLMRTIEYFRSLR